MAKICIRDERYVSMRATEFESGLAHKIKKVCRSATPRSSHASSRVGAGITESVDSVCRDMTYTQYMPIQKNLSKSQKRYTYKPL